MLLCCCAGGGLFGAHLLKASFNTIFIQLDSQDISSSSLQSVCFSAQTNSAHLLKSSFNTFFGVVYPIGFPRHHIFFTSKRLFFRANTKHFDGVVVVGKRSAEDIVAYSSSSYHEGGRRDPFVEREEQQRDDDGSHRRPVVHIRRRLYVSRDVLGGFWCVRQSANEEVRVRPNAKDHERARRPFRTRAPPSPPSSRRSSSRGRVGKRRRRRTRRLNEGDDCTWNVCITTTHLERLFSSLR